MNDIYSFPFQMVPTISEEQLKEQILSSKARQLPYVTACTPHTEWLSVAGGGPSLEDTFGDLHGCIAAVNGSLAWLVERGVVPHVCGVCDPSPHMVDIVAADTRVTYFLASHVHPSVFDKLIAAGCRIYVWHSGPMEWLDAFLYSHFPEGWLQIGGGSTMGLRWINLGYQLGFRKFGLHGFDSSFRNDPLRGRMSHAYPDHQDYKEWVEFDGFSTKPNFIGQVADFIGTMDRYANPDIEPVEIQVFGEGLLQTHYRRWQENNPGMHGAGPKPVLETDNFKWPSYDVAGKIGTLIDVPSIEAFIDHVPRRGVVVQAGGGVGIFPAKLSQYFAETYTFEADAENYACLDSNIKQVKGRNIFAFNAALGQSDCECRMERFEKDNCGAIRVEKGMGTPMRRLDTFALQGCDLLWLDVEGYERPVLEGAAATIDQFRPVVIIEEKAGLPDMYGLNAGSARNWLLERGYQRKTSVGSDTLFVPE